MRGSAEHLITFSQQVINDIGAQVSMIIFRAEHFISFSQQV